MKLNQIFSFILFLGIGGTADTQVLNKLKKKLEDSVFKTIQPPTAELHL